MDNNNGKNAYMAKKNNQSEAVNLNYLKKDSKKSSNSIQNESYLSEVDFRFSEVKEHVNS